MNRKRWNLLAVVAILLTSVPLPAGSTAQTSDVPTTTPIEHFIVLMQENHSFDNYFGTYPGADGFPEGTCVPVEPDNPQNKDCIEPFHLEGGQSADLDHTRETHNLQYNNGEMDGFVKALNDRNQEGRLAMGYYDDRELAYYWNIADEYVLFDKFFTSANGGSVENHMFWVAGQPGSADGRIPESGYGNDVITIFDRLEEAGISWKFYIQNYDPSLTYRTVAGAQSNRAAQVIWCPLLNFPRFIDNPALFDKIAPMDEYFDDLHNNTLPSVSFMVPSGASEHPPGSIFAGQRFVQSLIHDLMRSDSWETSAFMWTYDDWGGWYDHVPPPQVDDFGYGFRAPTLLVSPFAKRGYVDSTVLDFTSFLKFIQENWGVEPIAERDTAANNFLTAFDFDQEPREPEFLSWERNPVVKPQPNRMVLYVTYSSVFVVSALLIGLAVLKSWPRTRTPRAPERRR